MCGGNEFDILANMNRSVLVLSAALSAILLRAECVSPQAALPEAAFTRAEFRIRDPFVLADGGVYYLYESKPWDGGRGVFVRRSADLEHWTDKQQVMRVADDLPVRKVWAPEVHKYNGAYYLFVTLTMADGAYAISPLVPGREKMFSPRGTWVYRAESPMGPFEPVRNGPVPPQDWMTLDGTLYVEDGQPYMVFCHEWCQMKDGLMCYAPLAPDFASFTAAPTTMFRASDAMAGAGFVTDGPFLYRSPKSGALFMIWSNTIRRDGRKDPDYCVFVRKSAGGRLAGPWSKDELLFGKDGGHGMIFKAFDGRLMLTLHQPNNTPNERMALFEVEDTGAALRIKGGLKPLVACDDWKGWSHSVTTSGAGGRETVTVALSSPTNAAPPRFDVQLRVPGAGVRNVWTTDYLTNEGQHLWPQLWWDDRSTYESQLAANAPIAVGYDSMGVSPVALACSEASDNLRFGLYADDRTCEVVARCEFFSRPAATAREYTATILLDRSGRGFAETVRSCSEWVAAQNGFAPADVPEAAYEPLYSTWYAYLQDVHASELEREARLAASLGMKTMILDDGWHKEKSASFFSATGDWMPVASRFPDMKAHVEAVHRAGLKYMLWLSVPYVGDESKAWARFKDKLLYVHGKKSPGLVGVLDPRFPEVREYLAGTYERVVGEWGFDGAKLDFIDQFKIVGGDPALRDGYAGRDYRSVPEAVNRLMKDVLARLRRIKPDVLVEFRQAYMGPAILQYGNMMRAADCPADPCANRRRICDLRLTSGRTAVHSDMLVWSRDETPEGAAFPILNALFSAVQYSMVLAKLPPVHADVVRHWIAFSRAHREALLKGSFRPHHPEGGYTWIEGESAAERVVSVHAAEVCVPVDASAKPSYVVNATGGEGVLVELVVPCRAELFDVFGKSAGLSRYPAGLHRMPVPKSGYALVRND